MAYKYYMPAIYGPYRTGNLFDPYEMFEEYSHLDIQPNISSASMTSSSKVTKFTGTGGSGSTCAAFRIFYIPGKSIYIRHKRAARMVVAMSNLSPSELSSQVQLEDDVNACIKTYYNAPGSNRSSAVTFSANANNIGFSGYVWIYVSVAVGSSSAGWSDEVGNTSSQNECSFSYDDTSSIDYTFPDPDSQWNQMPNGYPLIRKFNANTGKWVKATTTHEYLRDNGGWIYRKLIE
jgi:hypothetical protein